VQHDAAAAQRLDQHDAPTADFHGFARAQKHIARTLQAGEPDRTANAFDTQSAHAALDTQRLVVLQDNLPVRHGGLHNLGSGNQCREMGQTDTVANK
jgi:hypothetical protein